MTTSVFAKVSPPSSPLQSFAYLPVGHTLVSSSFPNAVQCTFVGGCDNRIIAVNLAMLPKIHKQVLLRKIRAPRDPDFIIVHRLVDPKEFHWLNCGTHQFGKCAPTLRGVVRLANWRQKASDDELGEVGDRMFRQYVFETSFGTPN